MRFKLDENLDARLVSLVQQGGHDVETAHNEGFSGRDDSAIYDACLSAGRILITLDLDFSNPIRFPPAPTPGIIIVRPPRPVLPQIRATGGCCDSRSEKKARRRQALDYRTGQDSLVRSKRTDNSPSLKSAS